MLYLNRGRWDGKQLIPETWVKESTRVQVPATMPRNLYSKRQRSIDGRGVYGYNWWVNGRQAGGERFLPGAPEGTFCATGYAGNRLFIIPEWNMVVVRLGTDMVDSPVGARFWGEFLGMVGKAIMD
jgi:CubicO group peptidase (beta-lactamase class C family)